MIHRLVEMTFKEENIEDFLLLFEDVKSKIRNFEGCNSLQLLQDPENRCKISTSSIWLSENHLNEYRNSLLFENTWATTKSYFSDKAKAKSRLVIVIL